VPIKKKCLAGPEPSLAKQALRKPSTAKSTLNYDPFICHLSVLIKGYIFASGEAKCISSTLPPINCTLVDEFFDNSGIKRLHLASKPHFLASRPAPLYPAKYRVKTNRLTRQYSKHSRHFFRKIKQPNL
jgi:hypothetical protein